MIYMLSDWPTSGTLSFSGQFPTPPSAGTGVQTASAVLPAANVPLIAPPLSVATARPPEAGTTSGNYVAPGGIVSKIPWGTLALVGAALFVVTRLMKGR